MKKNFKAVANFLCILIAISMIAFISGCDSKVDKPATPSSQAIDKASAPSSQPADKSSAPKEAEKKLVLKFATNVAQTHPETQFGYKLSELAKAKSNGKIDIQVYHSGQLGDHKERNEGLRTGTLDMTMTTIGYLAPYEQVLNIFETAYIFKDNEHQKKVYNSEVGKKISDIVYKQGFVVMEFLEMGARYITNSKWPIKTPEDLKGIKLRVPDTKGSIDAFKAMGASPTPLAFSELYMALQQKVVDGQENPVDNIYGSKFYEVQKYLSLTGHQRLESMFLFGKVNWDKLSKEDQKIITEASKEAHQYIDGVITKNQKDLLEELKAKGMQVNEVDYQAFSSKVKPLHEQYVKEYGSLAKEFFDMIEKTK